MLEERAVWARGPESLHADKPVINGGDGAGNGTAKAGGSGIVIIRYLYDLRRPQIANSAATNVSPTSPTSDGFYPSGTVLTFTETPNPGWTFAGWQFDP